MKIRRAMDDVAPEQRVSLKLGEQMCSAVKPA